LRTRDDTSLDEYPIRVATIDSITDKLLIVSHGDHSVFRVTFKDSFYDKNTADGQRLAANNHTLDGLLAESKQNNHINKNKSNNYSNYNNNINGNEKDKIISARLQTADGTSPDDQQR